MPSKSFKMLKTTIQRRAEKIIDFLDDLTGPRPSRVYCFNDEASHDSFYTTSEKQTFMFRATPRAALEHECDSNNLLRRCPAENYELPCVPQRISRRFSDESLFSQCSSQFLEQPYAPKPIPVMVDLDFDIPVLETASSLWRLKSGPLSRPTVAPLKSEPTFHLNITQATPTSDSLSHFSERVYEVNKEMLFVESTSTIEYP
ncbi:hypothetical protein HWV62_45230 [Athelia sp. TMB]|nr:hypothetical protein HWV62_45230 [Athelia sp. TMB]